MSDDDLRFVLIVIGIVLGAVLVGIGIWMLRDLQ